MWEATLSSISGAGSSIWIIDADRAGYESLAAELQKAGHVVSFHDSLVAVTDALRARPETTPRLALIGCAMLSAHSSTFPMSFMAVARSDADDTVRTAFERGAVDVFTMPLGHHELRFKIERHLAAQSAMFAVQATAPASAGASAYSGELLFNQTFLTVGYGKGHEVTLTPREFQILGLLYKAPDHCITRASVFVSVWSGVKVCQKVLDVHVSKLRKKLKPLAININFVRPSNYVLDFPRSNAVAADRSTGYVGPDVIDAGARVSA